ncbi:unnamed protein product [Strongylus vulgaris]|uniref:Uncharacterized protein n=1 Tax=Strongylus vulgaris TaxID=40348 RepID=A0A3P7J1B7_STRVU|nr:unnamed protein product [Strongylus vulgaris]
MVRIFVLIVSSQNTRDILRAFELIETDMQIKTLISHDELERRVKSAQEISAKLEQLPDVVKSVFDECRSKLDAAMKQFINTTTIHDGNGLNLLCRVIANPGEVGGSANCKSMSRPPVMVKLPAYGGIANQ